MYCLNLLFYQQKIILNAWLGQKLIFGNKIIIWQKRTFNVLKSKKSQLKIKKETKMRKELKDHIK